VKKYANNAVIQPNPFGSVDEVGVLAFEEVVGAPLPSEYRVYLLEFNGGKFEKRYFARAGGIDGRIHNIYGLHAGPKYSRLAERWKLSECYDIGEAAPGVRDYVVFASTGTGDLLLLCLRNGAVFFLDHEFVEDDQEYGARFNAVPIATTFDEFVESLMPDSMIPK
jgi:hypothetical protein